ncbi:MAG TPA: hypothetical protein PLK65_02900 [Candidatus Cloacimonas sp.]|nr:hypothetical protein [Candidatus Cloacimonas sp.]HNS85179.1 hypothetical protein [Candidatus Cloacimonas sp.]HPX10120.1 hypothetical protein [Candidatus Cloacimonas sp.]HQB50542.1 hypothetical protein [Candidatus Cloacimonas sp.]HQM03251.1 hypothetical protein [Candidatus Cloacimonas sp.]
MRKTLLLLIFVISIVFCFAQEFNSFRYLSTSGALDGDVEYAFDPLDLNYLSGTRLYSGLSNFSGNDNIFMNSGDNYLLLGTSTDKTFLKKLKAALLFKYYDNEEPLTINCYPNPYDEYPTTDWGRVEYTWQNYSDTNGNELYDNYEYVHQKYENVDKNKGTDFSLVLSHPMGEKSVLGYKLCYLYSRESNTYAQDDILSLLSSAPTLEYTSTTYTLPEMDPTVEEETSSSNILGDFDTKDTNSTFRNQLGYLTKLNAWEFSGTFTLDYLNNCLETEDSASEVTIYNSDISDKANAYRKNTNEENGMFNQINGRIRYFLVSDDDPFHTGYISCGLGFGLKNLNVKQKELYNENEEDPYYYSSKNFSASGDLTGINFSANTRLNYPLNNKTFIGTGLFYTLQNDDLKGDYTYQISTKASFFNYDGSWNYTINQISKSAGKVEQEETVKIFRAPVGLEYWFTNNMKWAMRFGTIFTHTVEIFKESFAPNLIEPTLTECTYANGETASQLNDNTSLKESHSTKYSTSKTDFSYGICFKANDNLQIDLLTMFDNNDLELWNTNFLRNLKLSFTVIFQ